MKLIGHVSTAVLAATPVIVYRHLAPEMDAPGLSPFDLLWWVGIWAVAPDLDILLSRFTPIRHRGFASHSFFTAFFAGILVYLGFIVLEHEQTLFALNYPDLYGQLAPVRLWLTPVTALLAFLAVLVHILGDSITKTGVPLLAPNETWHMPLIGGHAAFDNYFLNAIPLAAAGYVLVAVYQFDPNTLRQLGHWRDILPAGLAF